MNFERRLAALIVSLGLLVLFGCQSVQTQSDPDSVTVGSLATSDGMTRQRLDAEVRRFAQRYSSKITQFFEVQRRGDVPPEERRRATMTQLEANSAAMGIAIGDNPVTNLLDMLVLATLTRMAAEQVAVDYHGIERAAVMIEFSRRLEKDIWTVSDSVLTAEQQRELMSLIEVWSTENPEQYFIYQVRFSSFSDAGAVDLVEIQKTGGLLTQFARAADEAEEFRLFGERLLFYLQFAPYLTNLQAQMFVYDVLAQPEIRESLVSANGVARTIEALPESRLAFIDQLVEGVGTERRALIRDVVGQQATLSQLFSDFRPIVESAAELAADLNEATQTIERTTTAVNLDLGGSAGEPMDVADYHNLITESGRTVTELNQLIVALDALIQSQTVNQQLPPAFNALRTSLNDAVNRFFLLAIATIIIYFIALYIYRRFAHPYRRRRPE